MSFSESAARSALARSTCITNHIITNHITTNLIITCCVCTLTFKHRALEGTSDMSSRVQTPS